MPRECSVCLHRDHAAIDAALIAGRSPRSIGAEFGVNHQAVERHRANHLPQAIRRAARQALAREDASQACGSFSAEGTSLLTVRARPAPFLAISDADLAPHASAPRGRRRGLQLCDTPNALDQSSSDATVAPEAVSHSATSSASATAGPVDLHAAAVGLQSRAMRILEHAERDGDAKTALVAIREARGVLEHMARLQERTGAAGVAASLADSPEWHRTRAAIVVALVDHPEARLAVAEALISTGAAA